MWVLIKDAYKRESKEKRRKERGTTKKVYHHPRMMDHLPAMMMTGIASSGGGCA